MSKTRKPVSSDAVLIGERIRTARTKKELSQEKLGDMLSITGVMVLGYEKGRSRITTELLAKIADITGVSMGWLLTGDIPEERRKAHTEQELDALELVRAVPAKHQQAVLDALRAITNAFTKS